MLFKCNSYKYMKLFSFSEWHRKTKIVVSRRSNVFLNRNLSSVYTICNISNQKKIEKFVKCVSLKSMLYKSCVSEYQNIRVLKSIETYKIINENYDQDN